MTHRLHFMRRIGCHCWEIPIGLIHGHRALGFSAATNGRPPVEIDDYNEAHRQADALNLTLRERGFNGTRGKVYIIAQGPFFV